jgi:hypothetical protein
MQALADSQTCSNTQKAYEPKEIEWNEYCDTVVTNKSSYVRGVTKDKVYRFMVYVAMRSKRKPPGSSKKASSKKKQALLKYFDHEQYLATNKMFEDWLKSKAMGEDSTPPCPEDAIGADLYNTYKSVIKLINGKQLNAQPWEQIWTSDVLVLTKWVKLRRKISDKASHKEKVDGNFDPFKLLANFGRLEERFWQSGYPNHCSAVTWLRNRMVLLATTKGILRGESIMKAELSDFLGVPIQQKNDPHMSYICVMEIAFGKR